MAERRPIVNLGDVISLQTGFPFKSGLYSRDPADPRLLRGDNVAQGRLRWDGEKRYPRGLAARLQDFSLGPGDVILAMDRPWIEAGLKYAVVTNDDLPALLVQRVARLRGTDRLDTAYLRYVVASRAFTDYILGVQTGTAVPHISGEQIRGFSFPLPPLPEQRAIASVLGSIDDKIDLNRRMNATLEATARAIFKAWFVDFEALPVEAGRREPVALVAERTAEYGRRASNPDLPRGWSVLSLDKIAEFRNGLALQRFPAADGERRLPVIKIAQMRTGRPGADEFASGSLDPAFIVDDGDVLFSWSGSLEVCLWTGGRGALNQHLFRVSSAHTPKWFYLLWTKHHLPTFREIAANKATTMGHIQRHHLTEAEVLVPPPGVMEAMGRVLALIVEEQVQLGIETRTLEQVRDTLLPKLLSGEVRVKDIA